MGTSDDEAKPASAARIYDYFLGGTHNFPADRAAAQTMLQVLPLVPQMARTNRAFLRRAVRYLAESGVRQFLDVGSGIPTEGNVHEIVQQVEPEARVVYVDIDPLAVAESLELLDGNPLATVVNADLRDPRSILSHPQVTALLDFDRPIGLVLGAVLHFVPDETAYDVVGRLLAAMAPGSHLLISHATADEAPHEQDEIDVAHDIYRHRTATPSGCVPGRRSSASSRGSTWSNRAWCGCHCGVRPRTTRSTSPTIRRAAPASVESDGSRPTRTGRPYRSR